MTRPYLAAVMLLVAAQAMAPAIASAAESTLAGAVRDAETSAPLAGAVVAMPDLDRVTATDASGRYVLRGIPPGPHHIEVRRIGYAPRVLHALVPRAGQLEINVSLVPEPVPIAPQNVRAPVFVRGADSGETLAYPDRESSIVAVRNHPLLAEPDAFLALGGGEVVLSPETPNGVHIRGGESDHTVYLLDGIPVLNPYHAAGVSSAWNPDALSRLELDASAPALAAAHALSGTVAAITRSPGHRLRAQGSLSTTQGRLTVDGPLGAGVGYVVSLRSGLHDALAPDDEPSYVKSRNLDWLGKLEAPAFGGRLQVLGYENSNELGAARVADADTAPSATDAALRNDFAWHSRSYGFEWRRDLSPGTVRVRGYHASGDAGASWMAEKAGLDMASARRDAGFAASLEHTSPGATTGGELRIETIATSYRIRSDAPSVPSLAIEARTPVATLLGRHTRVLAARTRLTLSAALATTGAEWRAAPGAEVRWTAAERLAFSARYARAHQFAQSLRNAESVVGNVFPVDLHVGAGTPGVPIARSDIGLVAAEARPWAGVRLGVQAYARASRGLLLAAPRSSAPFATGGFAVGSGSARGIAVDLAASAARYGIVASYGLQAVRLRSAEADFVPAHGARHLLEGGLTLFPTPTLSLRVGGAAALGRRATPASGALEWETCNLLDLGCEFAGNPLVDSGALGATALPAYSRVDFGVRKHWHLTLGKVDAEVALFGTVTNILNHRNILTYVRDPETGETAAIEMRPPSPLVVGLDWRF